MNEEETLICFDLRGYLVIEDVLSAAEVAALNRLMDSQELPPPEDDTLSARFGGYLEWGQIYCDLLDHDRIMPYLKAVPRRRISPGPLLRHLYARRHRVSAAARGQHALRPRRNTTTFAMGGCTTA